MLKLIRTLSRSHGHNLPPDIHVAYAYSSFFRLFSFPCLPPPRFGVLSENTYTRARGNAGDESSIPPLQHPHHHALPGFPADDLFMFRTRKKKKIYLCSE